MDVMNGQLKLWFTDCHCIYSRMYFKSKSIIYHSHEPRIDIEIKMLMTPSLLMTLTASLLAFCHVWALIIEGEVDCDSILKQRIRQSIVEPSHCLSWALDSEIQAQFILTGNASYRIEVALAP